MEQIEIRIGKNGKIDLKVLGVKGDACKSLTKTLEKALGSVTESKNTSEIYEQKNTVSGEQSIGGNSY